MTRFRSTRWQPDRARAQTHERAERWLTLAALLAAEAARSHAPVRTGRLQRSIVPLPVVRADGRSISGVWAQAPYALWVEIGTRRNPARPYLRPALDTLRRFADALILAARSGGRP